MSTSPLSRIAGPLAVVTGALVVATRLPHLLFALTGGDLTAFVLGPIHGIASVVTVVAFGLLVLTLVAIGFVLDWSSPGTGANYSPDAFRIAMATQYVVWAVGLAQLMRHRRRTRRHLWDTDPEAYDALRRGELVSRP